MPNINITPKEVLLTAGKAATFEATDAKGLPISVNWSLNPPTIGTFSPAASTPATSATSAAYVAPSPLGAGAQTIALIASTASDSASATISLTPIAIVPAKVALNADEEQRFLVSIEQPAATAAATAAAAPESITWILSPQLGTLDQETGLYKAPHDIPDPTTVSVIATTPTLGKQGVAIVNLISTPWRGIGVDILGAYLLLVFSVVFLMMGLWPPALPSPETARADRIEAETKSKDLLDAQKANRIEAERTLEAQKIANREAAKTLEEKKKAADSVGNRPQPAEALGAKPEGSAANSEAANTTPTGTDNVAQEVAEARADLAKKKKVEEEVNSTDVRTKLVPRINRELDLLWLVLLAGALGSFLHTAQSYSDYIGNRTLKISWAWWYCLRPFIGAGLALVFYAAARGGVMAVASGSTAKAAELNPFGLVSVAAMVGMFSKAATTKLGEVFDTLFKSDKAGANKDPLVGSSQTPDQPAGKAPAGGGAASTVAK
jgi:hypothetical protein